MPNAPSGYVLQTRVAIYFELMNDAVQMIDVINECIVTSKIREYVALSYIWGDVEQLLLNSVNLEEMSKQKALRYYEKLLPTTIRGALAMANDLGFQFLLS